MSHSYGEAMLVIAWDEVECVELVEQVLSVEEGDTLYHDRLTPTHATYMYIHVRAECVIPLLYTHLYHKW